MEHHLEEKLKDVASNLGEHFEHYVLAVQTSNSSCSIKFDCSFAAKGLLDFSNKIVDLNTTFDTTAPVGFTLEIQEDDEGEDDTNSL